jgi:predicted metalloprotease with PDZ domain
MMPYDFSKENYSRLGYVAEGVTTYFGDQFLHRCGVYSDEQYFKELSILLDKHLENPGRFNLSLADSSFDTWLDGYTPGIPWRKVSIYNEGALCAFLTDIAILNHSENSLDKVMLELYENFGKKKIGYTEADYRELCEKTGNRKLPDIFDRLIYGLEDYIPHLQNAFSLLGFELLIQASDVAWEALYGFRLDENLTITAVLPHSAADKAGLWLGDRLISWDGKALHSWSELKAMDFNAPEAAIVAQTQTGSKSLQINKLPDFGFKKSSLRLLAENDLYQRWKNR